MEDLFEIQRKCLNAMGHRLALNSTAAEVQKQEHHTRKQWTTMLHTFILILVASAQLPIIYFCVYEIDDLSVATAGLSIIFTNVLSVIKLSTFLLFKNKFFKLMAKLADMYENLHEPYSRYVVGIANKTSNRLVKVYYYSLICTGLYFMLAPILKIGWNKITKKPVVFELPMPMRFPFEFESTPNYELAYMYTGCVTFSVIMYSAAVDGLFIAFTINLRGHFKALQHIIISNTFKKSNVQLQHDISFIIQYHELLLSLSKRVCHIYSPIIFGQFLMTSLEVCVIVYQLVTHLDTYIYLLTYGSFLCSVMIQLFIYCYGGEIIRHESLMVSIAVQSSHWYNLPPCFRRMLVLIIQRSQREVVIRSAFYVASLANFMTILKAAMSYIALIQSIE